jgi:NitT/TauT family transport system substrate-binding protein
MALTVRRWKLAISMLGLAVLAAACGGGDGSAPLGSPGECEEMLPITFRQNWVFNYNQLPMQIAQKKGWYEEQCLDVKLEAGKGSADTATNVASGAADVGLADAVAVMQAQAKEVPVTGVGVMWQENDFAVLIRNEALEDKTPEPTDLQGMTFGAVTTGSPYIFWKAFVNQQDLDTSSIKEVSIAAPGFAEMAQGSVDFLANFSGSVYALKASGVPVTVLEAADFGQEGYGLSIIANDRWLAENGEAMERFLTATAKAMVWSRANAREAVEILESFNPAVGKSQATIDAELLPYEDSFNLWTPQGPDATEQYLRFSEDGLETTRDVLYEGDVLEGEPFQVEDFWTEEYLPAPSSYAPEN